MYIRFQRKASSDLSICVLSSDGSFKLLGIVNFKVCHHMLSHMAFNGCYLSSAVANVLKFNVLNFTLRLVLADILQKGFKFITHPEVKIDAPLFMWVPRQVLSGPSAAETERGRMKQMTVSYSTHTETCKHAQSSTSRCSVVISLTLELLAVATRQLPV